MSVTYVKMCEVLGKRWVRIYLVFAVYSLFPGPIGLVSFFINLFFGRCCYIFLVFLSY